MKSTGRFNQGYDIGQRMEAKIAFLAGWNAALVVETELVPDKLDTGSLFPTMGLAHDV